MEIRLLKEDYILGETVYNDFLNNSIDDDNYSDEIVIVDSVPDFPIYMGKLSGNERENQFIEALETIGQYYLKTDREIHFNKNFWYSLFCTKKREYILDKYPEVKKSEKEFRNVVLKKFDWENYVYKCILGAQYVCDNIESEEEKLRMYKLIVQNLDLYNYIIKYEIFRNDVFLLNILEIIDKNDLSEIMKAKIKDRPDLGKDERYGRRVIFELNKSYPVVMAPTLDQDDLEKIVLISLSKYLDGSI